MNQLRAAKQAAGVEQLLLFALAVIVAVVVAALLILGLIGYVHSIGNQLGGHR